MKMLLALWMIVFSMVAVADDQLAYSCRSVKVTVDRVVRNDFIYGHVTGLPAAAMKNYRMVFYVKTNKYYLHPYLSAGGNQTPEQSYVKLNANGEFKVATVLREHPASKLVAMLVPNNHKIKSTSKRLRPLFGIFGGLLKNYCSYSSIPGTGDFFVNE